MQNLKIEVDGKEVLIKLSNRKSKAIFENQTKMETEYI